jgi:hypothetical protein
MTKQTQAQRMFAKFGGARPLALALGLAPSTVYRWDYGPERGGSSGVIPTRALPKIAALARREGIFLTEQDYDPRPR